jgi:CRP-like cAMP-binding protein
MEVKDGGNAKHLFDIGPKNIPTITVQNPLIEHIKKAVEIKPEDEETILGFFKPLHINKKQTIQEADSICSSTFFVVKGCLRMFFQDDKGTQHTTQFAIENWWLTDIIAFHSQKVTEFYIQAVEKSDVLAINLTSYEELLKQFPELERYFRIIYQKGFGASQVRMKYQHDFSREEMYHHFARQYPSFLQRVPQYLLASFLGFTPEYLSELRKKRS